MEVWGQEAWLLALGKGFSPILKKRGVQELVAAKGGVKPGRRPGVWAGGAGLEPLTLGRLQAAGRWKIKTCVEQSESKARESNLGRPCLKHENHKRSWGPSLVVECSPNACQVLGPTPANPKLRNKPVSVVKKNWVLHVNIHGPAAMENSASNKPINK